MDFIANLLESQRYAFYYIGIPGIGGFWLDGITIINYWPAFLVGALVLLSLAVFLLVVIVRKVLKLFHNRPRKEKAPKPQKVKEPKVKKAKPEKKEKRNRTKKQKDAEVLPTPPTAPELTVSPAEKHMQEVMELAPGITAYTEAQFPLGVCPRVYLHKPAQSMDDANKREIAYKVWSNEQKALLDREIKARKKYLDDNDYGYVSDEDVATASEEQEEKLTPAEIKRNKKIEKDNARRIAKAKKLLKKEENKKK